MAQNDLLNRLLSKGTNTAGNFPKSRAVPAKESLYGPKDTKVPVQEVKTILGPKTTTPTLPAPDNKVAAVDQSIYRFKSIPDANALKDPLNTPLARAAARSTTFAPRQVPGSVTSINTDRYLLTEAGENLITENNDNLII